MTVKEGGRPRGCLGEGLYLDGFWRRPTKATQGLGEIRQSLAETRGLFARTALWLSQRSPQTMKRSYRRLLKQFGIETAQIIEGGPARTKKIVKPATL